MFLKGSCDQNFDISPGSVIFGHYLADRGGKKESGHYVFKRMHSVSHVNFFAHMQVSIYYIVMWKKGEHI